MYHLLTINVRSRTEINILHINFVKENHNSLGMEEPNSI